MAITDLLTKTLPYVVGSKTPPAIPLNVKLILDKDFKNTIYKTTAIAAGGFLLAMVISSYIKKNR